MQACRRDFFYTRCCMDLLFDGHTHIFNVGFLPVAGILLAHGASADNAIPTAAIVNHFLEREKPPEPAFSEGVRSRLPLIDMLERHVDGTLELPSGRDFIAAFALSVPSHDLKELEGVLRSHSDRAADVASRGRSEAMIAAARPDDADLRARLDLILRATARETGPIETGSGESIRAFNKSAGGIVEWLMTLTRHESRIVRQFAGFWSEPGHFLGRTHHMMDLAKHYQGKPEYDFATEQHDRMRAVAAEAEVPLIGFTAFDPFRDDSLNIVKRAISSGFCGVKFYPPSGYKPLGNTKKDIKNGPKPDVVNARNHEFFQWCVDNDVPVFTHCTAGGLESRPGTGVFSDPHLWRDVLNTNGLSGLRLCFGHAGGQDGWLATTDEAGDSIWEASYAREVADLCETFPNVFCDFGYFDEALTPPDSARFGARLSVAFRQFPKRLSIKCCFGTDWHLVTMESEAPNYPGQMRICLREAGLGAYTDQIMYKNALAYLDLPGFLRRSERALSERERSQIRTIIGDAVIASSGMNGCARQ